MYTLLSCAMWCYNNCTFHPNCIWYDEQCAWWIVFMIQGQGPPNCCSILLSPLWICDMVSSTEAAWKTWRPIQSLVFYLLFAKLWPIWNALNILVFLSPCDCPPSRHTLQHFVAFLAMMSEEHSTSWPCVQRMQALTRHPPSWMIAKPRCKQTQVLSSGRSNPSRLSSLIIRAIQFQYTEQFNFNIILYSHGALQFQVDYLHSSSESSTTTRCLNTSHCFVKTLFS
jgi:hypothetical protein